MRIIELKAPDEELIYEFDWTDEIAEGITLNSVTHAAPDPLVITHEETDAPNNVSRVRIIGGDHGGVYVVTATALMSTGESIDGQFTLRVMQPPVYANAVAP